MNGHPALRALVAVADGTADPQLMSSLAPHLEHCPACQQAIARARSQRLDEAEGTRLTSAPSGGTPEAAAWSRSAAPSQNDLWRLSWDDVGMLAVIASQHNEDRVAVRPVSVETLSHGAAPTRCILLGAAVTLFVSDVAVWVARGALDSHVGVLESMLAPPEDLVDPSGFADAVAGVLGAVDDEVQLDRIDDLIDAVETLAMAEWSTTAAVAVAPNFDALVAAGITTPRALDIVRGDAPTPTEEALLTQADLDGPWATVPRDIRSLLDQPRYKQRIRGRAQRQRHSERSERNDLAAEAPAPSPSTTPTKAART